MDARSGRGGRADLRHQLLGPAPVELREQAQQRAHCELAGGLGTGGETLQQHRHRALVLFAPDQTERRRTQDGILEQIDQPVSGPGVADAGQGVDHQLAHVRVLAGGGFEQPRHDAGSTLDERFDGAVAAARILAVRQRSKQRARAGLDVRTGAQALDGRLANAPARIAQAIHQQGKPLSTGSAETRSTARRRTS